MRLPIRFLLLVVPVLLFMAHAPGATPLPRDADGCLRLGAGSLDEGNADAALLAFTAAESLHPSEQGRHVARHLRAHCLTALGRGAEAAALLPDPLDAFVQETCFGPLPRSRPGVQSRPMCGRGSDPSCSRSGRR